MEFLVVFKQKSDSFMGFFKKTVPCVRLRCYVVWTLTLILVSLVLCVREQSFMGFTIKYLSGPIYLLFVLVSIYGIQVWQICEAGVLLWRMWIKVWLGIVYRNQVNMKWWQAAYAHLHLRQERNTIGAMSGTGFCNRATQKNILFLNRLEIMQKVLII